MLYEIKLNIYLQNRSLVQAQKLEQKKREKGRQK